jgi:putative phosphoesterase
MKIGIISDVHANYDALCAVFDELKRAGVNMVLNAGDNVGYSPFPDECVRLLKDELVQGVRGNYDEAVGFGLASCGCGDCCDAVERIRQASLRWTQGHVSDETLKYLRELPDYRLIGTDAGKILVMHGGLDLINEHIDAEDDERLQDIARRTGAVLVVMGHTHRAFQRAVGSTVFVNPGSVGKPTDGDPRASYAVVDVNGQISVSLCRVEYPVDHNVRALMEAGLPAAIGDMLRDGRGDTLA